MKKGKIFFTPGPTELYPEIRKFFEEALDNNICSLNHRSSEFMEIFRHTADMLKNLMKIPNNYKVFFLSSATECMDRIVQNCVESRSFHFVNGAFAERFYRTAIELNKNASKADAEFGKSFNFGNISIDNSPELICITQNETSTGVAIDTGEIYKFKKRFPDSIIAVDIVTSAPFVEIDFDRIDCAFFSVQKGFGLPAGLGVLLVNEKCIDKAEQLRRNNVSIGSYHNFLSLNENALKYQTTETPNVLAIYLLGRVCKSLSDYGIRKIRKETEDKAKVLYDFFDNHEFLKPFVSDKKDRSKTIINVEAGNRQNEIKKKLAVSGIIAGSGYGKYKQSQIRLANFPMHKMEDVIRITELLK